jgi:hypothetical protein
MNGKGSKPRPLSIPYSKFVDNYDKIDWGKKLSIKQSEIDKHVEDVNRTQMLSELPEDYKKTN